MQATNSKPYLFKQGQSGNPEGRPKGAINARTRQWNELHESIVGYHTEKFNETLGTLWSTDPLVAMRMYLELLNYFKPRLSSVTQHNSSEATAITLNIDATNVPLFPSNIDEQDNIEDISSIDS